MASRPRLGGNLLLQRDVMRAGRLLVLIPSLVSWLQAGIASHTVVVSRYLHLYSMDGFGWFAFPVADGQFEFEEVTLVTLMLDPATSLSLLARRQQPLYHTNNPYRSVAKLSRSRKSIR